MRSALALLVLVLAGARSCRAAASTHIPRTPEKCGRLLVRAMWQAPGAVLQPATPCLHFNPMVTIPARFTVQQNANPLVVEILYRDKRLGSVVLPAAPPAPPPPSLTFIDKRPRLPVSRRWTEAGVEFVSVLPAEVSPITAKESRP